MEKSKTEINSDGPWSKTPVPNLVRYRASGTFFARIRVGGKLIRKSLKTKTLSVAKLRLTDLEKEERTKAEANQNATQGKMTFAQARDIYLSNLDANKSLMPRTKEYRRELINALQKSWPRLEISDVRRISHNDCQTWAKRFGKKASPTVYNNAIGTLRMILDIPIKSGIRYGNPAEGIKRQKPRPKQLHLPSPEQFIELVETIRNNDGAFNHRCSELVRFLAFGGFRKGEASRVTWNDCDFKKREIIVRGDPETGTKNWSIRIVPMIDEMHQMLSELRTQRSHESADQPVMRIKECRGALQTACRKLGIPRLTHHDLRHLFATRCIEAGVDIPTVSRWLGRKDGGAIAMKTYGHLRDHHSAAMAAKVNFGTIN